MVLEQTKRVRLSRSVFYKICFNQMMQYQESILWCYCGGDLANISYEYVIQGIEELDEAAELIVDKYAEYICDEISLQFENEKVVEICIKGFWKELEHVIMNKLENRFCEREEY